MVCIQRAELVTRLCRPRGPEEATEPAATVRLYNIARGVATQQAHPDRIEKRNVVILAPDGLVVETVDIFRYGSCRRHGQSVSPPVNQDSIRQRHSDWDSFID